MKLKNKIDYASNFLLQLGVLNFGISKDLNYLFSSNSNIVDRISSSLNLITKLKMNLTKSSYFKDKGYSLIKTKNMINLINNIGFENINICATSADNSYYEYHNEDIIIGFKCHNSYDLSDLKFSKKRLEECSFWCNKGQEGFDSFNRKIQKIIWQKSNILEVTIEKIENTEQEIVINLSPANFPNLMEIKEFKNILTYCQKANDKNIFRGILLYGNPGTGKSACSLYVAHALNMRTLHLKSISNNIEVSLLKEIINTYEPDIIIIDDLDRSSMLQSGYLELLEFVSNNCKFIFATVNNISNFDKALLRPGRFDEIIKFNSLDHKILIGMLSDELKVYFDKIKDWPISYILELIKRSEFLSPEEAIEDISNLSKRIIEAKKHYEDSNNDLLIDPDL